MAKNEGQLLDSELARQAGRDGTEQDVYNVYYRLDAGFPSIPRISQRKKEIIYNTVQYLGNRIFQGNISFLTLINFSFHEKTGREKRKIRAKSRRYICILVKDRWKNSAVEEWTHEYNSKERKELLELSRNI